jgi:hypothetical protein
VGVRIEAVVTDHHLALVGNMRGHPIEDAFLVHAALGHQKMEVGVEINPVPEGLDGGDIGICRMSAAKKKAAEAVVKYKPGPSEDHSQRI